MSSSLFVLLLARAREAKDKGRGEMDPIKTGDGVPFSKTYRPLVCSPFLFSLCVLSASGSGQVLSVLSVLSVLCHAELMALT